MYNFFGTCVLCYFLCFLNGYQISSRRRRHLCCGKTTAVHEIDWWRAVRGAQRLTL